MELGEQLTWLLLCYRYILFAFCRFALKLFLTLLTEAESKGLCLEGLTALCPFLTSMRPLSWGGHVPHPQGLAGHSTGALYKGSPSSPSRRAEARAQECQVLEHHPLLGAGLLGSQAPCHGL